MTEAIALTCPCGGRYDRVLVSEPRYRIVRCGACGLHATDPRQADDHYDDSYFEKNYLERADHWRRSHAYWFRRVVAPLFHDRPRPRILDVGCGIGLFLSTVSSRWDRVGLEPAGTACEIARARFGLDVKALRLEDLEPEGGFDVVTFWDVVEHLPDPIGTLRAAARHLRPDGYLVVKVPDIDRAARLAGRLLARAGKGTVVFQAGAHLYQFDRRSLRSTLRRAGYDPLELGSHTPPYGLRAFFMPGRLSGRVARLVLHAAGLSRTLVAVARARQAV
jgi:2-polyprenyl-3-methyl-5-hydroxy-6-metoxy-1,4-benzoquinol methylase